MMQKKVEAEGEKEEELFEKFMCYCKAGASSLGKSIGDAETKIPQLESQIKAAAEMKAQLEEDVKNHQNDRAAAKAAMAKSTAIREKEAAAFAKEHAEATANIEAAKKATAAISKGMAGGFLQTSAAAVLRKLALSEGLSDNQRDMLTSFLAEGSGASAGYAPASGEIVGILKQLTDTMEADLGEAMEAEKKAKAEYEALMEAKQKEVDALTKAIEEKLKRVGELGVELVNLKEDLDDTATSLGEDKKFLADLEKNCELKKKEWAERCKMRQMEITALAETIKILNDDDALELFKKTIPSASLLQVQVTAKDVQQRALQALQSLKRANGPRDHRLDFIALALRGKSVDFTKVIKMIDDMVVLLGKEQADDDAKKEWCTVQFDQMDDKKKALERSISDLEKSIEEDKEAVETLKGEIEALEEGIVNLDKDVTQATEQRKEENTEYVAELAANTAAVELIKFAKNRMNKFYNPKLYKPPPKRELTEEERITLNMGGTLAPTNPPAGIAGTGIGLAQNAAAPPPPPAADLSYKKKGEESGGVLAMMDSLVNDIDTEIQEMEFEEKDSQEDYEKMMGDASAKRAEDSKSITDKEAAKAETEASKGEHEDTKMATSTELMETKQVLVDLHKDCDWLLSKYDERKEARTNEIDALKKAKDVLKGADYSLLQVTGKQTRLMKARLHR